MDEPAAPALLEDVAFFTVFAVEPHPLGVEVPDELSCVGWAEVPEPAALAEAPQCAAVEDWPFDDAPALPVETLAPDPGWDELPAVMDVGWRPTWPGGAEGLESAAAGTASASIRIGPRKAAIVAGLTMLSYVPPVYRVETH